MRRIFTIVALWCTVTFAFANEGCIHPQSYTSAYFTFESENSFLWYGSIKGVRSRLFRYSIPLKWEQINEQEFPTTFTEMVQNGKNGVAIRFNGEVYHSTDSFATVKKIDNVYLDKVYASSKGFVGHKLNIGIYFSPNGTDWTKLINPYNIIAQKKELLVALGSKSTYYTSEDGGQTWQDISPTLTKNLSIIDIISVDTLMAKDQSNNLKITYNRFTNIINSNTLPATYQSLVFNNAQTGFLTTRTANIAFRTNDGGVSWNPVTYPLAGQATQTVYFGKYLYANINASAYRSPDNGTTWELILQGSLSPGNFDISFYGDLGITTGESGTYSLSYNKGVSFVQGTAPISSQDLMACEVINDSTIVVGDRRGQVFISFDKGNSWAKKTSSTSNYYALSFSASPDGKFICMERYGQPAISTDYGNTFKYYTVGGGTHFSALKSDGTLWDLRGTNGFLLETLAATNYTLRTEIARVSGVTIPKRLFMPTNNFGYIFSRNTSPTNTMTVYVTSDGWQTYQSYETNIGQNITTYISPFANGTDSVMFTMQNSYSIFFSKNKGESWENRQVADLLDINGTNYPILGSHFFNRDHYFLLSDGIIYTANKSTPQVYTAQANIHSLLPQALSAYPNPAREKIQLNIETLKNLKIYNSMGKIMLEINDYNNAYIQLSHFKSGMYFIQATQSNGLQHTTSFIKL